jgi:hypothetical protein
MTEAGPSLPSRLRRVLYSREQKLTERGKEKRRGIRGEGENGRGGSTIARGGLELKGKPTAWPWAFGLKS